MENSQSVWRPWTKIVAIVDMAIIFLTAIYLLYRLVVLGSTHLLRDEIFGGFRETKTIHGEVNETEIIPYSSTLLGIIWVVCTITILVAAFQLWAAFNLLRATSVEKDPREALGIVKIYSRVNIIFLIYYLLVTLCFRNSWLCIAFLCRFPPLPISSRFSKELKAAIDARQIASFEL